MGSQHSKNKAVVAARKRPLSSSPVNNNSNKTLTAHKERTVANDPPSHTEELAVSSSSSLAGVEVQAQRNKMKPVPSKLKRFRVKVPQSMVPGDIMTIKLNGILTKILIATPTTSTGKAESEVAKTEPSRAATSCSATSSSSITLPPSPIDSVIASTDAGVPEGKMIVEAKPVIVVHAVFTEDDKELKDQMIDEAMRQVIQETVNCGCNSILGMTVSIKKNQLESSGYLIKACGTPCLLMPAQVLLSPTTNGPAHRKRTSSAELVPPIRRQ